jgi:hypothetical protein
MYKKFTTKAAGQAKAHKEEYNYESGPSGRLFACPSFVRWPFGLGSEYSFFWFFS